MVYTKMAIKIEATKELMAMIEKSAREWKQLKLTLEDQYHHYDTYAKDMFGMNVDFEVFENVIIINGATIVNEDKYINFLLRYGNMHDE